MMTHIAASKTLPTLLLALLLFQLTGCAFTRAAFKEEYPQPCFVAFQKAALTREDNLVVQFLAGDRKRENREAWCLFIPREAIEGSAMVAQYSAKRSLNDPEVVRSIRQMPLIQAPAYTVYEEGCSSHGLSGGREVPFYHYYFPTQPPGHAGRYVDVHLVDLDGAPDGSFFLAYDDPAQEDLYHVAKIALPLPSEKGLNKAKLLTVPGRVVLDAITFPVQLAGAVALMVIGPF